MAYTAILVTATYASPDDEDVPAAGEVEFRLSGPMDDGDTLIAPTPIIATLTETGELPADFDLLATNDPTTTPANRVYTVIERLLGLDGAHVNRYDVVIPFDAPGGTVDLADLVPVSQVPIYPYALLTAEESTFTGDVVIEGTLTVDGVPIPVPAPDPEPWTDLDLINGWANAGEPYADAACLLSPDGRRVYLRGAVTSPTGVPSICATLGLAYRPAGRRVALAPRASDLTALDARGVVIDDTGDITIYTNGAGRVYTFDAISFDIDP